MNVLETENLLHAEGKAKRQRKGVKGLPKAGKGNAEIHTDYRSSSEKRSEKKRDFQVTEETFWTQEAQ